MSFVLEPLPFAENALEPCISRETVSYHYGKHHQGYVTKLNAYFKAQNLATVPLESLLTKSQPPAVFNNAAQIWNHTFYWNSLCAPNTSKVPAELEEPLKKAFGSVEEFKTKFKATASSHFGSGWVWLVVNSKSDLQILETHDAFNPLVEGQFVPLMVIDVWEHAYYIDKRNDRASHIDDFFKIVNWDFALKNYKAAAKI